ncbi:MAG TPA: 4Fe-4S dicluster domain-containing protein [Armatimonadota bacterium]|nr:4Fe-4S dicluster domain-containing protein [Armatimonadota bacterium]
MGFFTDTTLCIGCKACEVACKQWNQLPADGYDWTGFSYDNTQHLSETTWRHVAFKEQMMDGRGRWLMMSDVCKHCEAAPCQEACPTGSIIYNEFGNVYVQTDICNGCSYCVVACPFGVLGKSEDDGHAHKCTLCYDRQKADMVPACAKACPTESIQYGPLDGLRDRARRRVTELQSRGQNDAYLYGADPMDGYSRLNAFFLLLDHPNNYNLPEQPRHPQTGMGLRYAVGLAAGAALTGLWAALARTAGTEDEGRRTEDEKKG